MLAGGLVALVVLLALAWAVAQGQGAPGPGAGLLVRHTVAAVAAVVLQVYADRTSGARGTLGAVGVIVVVGVALTYDWLL